MRFPRWLLQSEPHMIGIDESMEHDRTFLVRNDAKSWCLGFRSLPWSSPCFGVDFSLGSHVHISRCNGGHYVGNIGKVFESTLSGPAIQLENVSTFAYPSREIIIDALVSIYVRDIWKLSLA